jgi:hypothetical protein
LVEHDAQAPCQVVETIGLCQHFKAIGRSPKRMKEEEERRRSGGIGLVGRSKEKRGGVR